MDCDMSPYTIPWMTLGRGAEQLVVGGIADDLEAVVTLLTVHNHHKHGGNREGVEIMTISSLFHMNDFQQPCSMSLFLLQGKCKRKNL